MCVLFPAINYRYSNSLLSRTHISIYWQKQQRRFSQQQQQHIHENNQFNDDLQFLAHHKQIDYDKLNRNIYSDRKNYGESTEQKWFLMAMWIYIDIDIDYMYMCICNEFNVSFLLSYLVSVCACRINKWHLQQNRPMNLQPIGISHSITSVK